MQLLLRTGERGGGWPGTIRQVTIFHSNAWHPRSRLSLPSWPLLAGVSIRVGLWLNSGADGRLGRETSLAASSREPPSFQRLRRFQIRGLLTPPTKGLRLGAMAWKGVLGLAAPQNPAAPLSPFLKPAHLHLSGHSAGDKEGLLVHAKAGLVGMCGKYFDVRPVRTCEQG